MTIPSVNPGTANIGGTDVDIVSLLGPGATPQNSPEVINGNVRKRIILADPLTGAPLDLQNGVGVGAVASVAGKTGTVTLQTGDLTDIATASLDRTNATIARAVAQNVKPAPVFTFQNTYLIPTSAAQIVRQLELSRKSMVIRNPNPVAFQVGFSGLKNENATAPANFYDIPPYSEYPVASGSYHQVLVRPKVSTDIGYFIDTETEVSVVPAGLTQIYGTQTVVSTVTPRALTPYKTKHMALANVVIANNNTFVPIGMSKDRSTFFARNGLTGDTLYQSVDDGANWTLVKQIQSTGIVSSLIETDDGEALAYVGIQQAGGNIWKSSGWSTSKTAATWTSVLGTGVAGTYVHAGWNRDGSFGSNGVGIVGEYGTQTNDAGVGARRVWATSNYGATWTVVFDVFVANPAPNSPQHIHGTYYDEAEDRMWFSHGDMGTGLSSYLTCGAGIAIKYSDDRGATWTAVPMPSMQYGQTTPNTLAGRLQVTGIMATKNCIVAFNDFNQYGGSIVIPKLGYKKLGDVVFGNRIYENNITLNFGYYRARGDGTPIFSSTWGGNGAPTNIYCSADDGLSWHEAWSDRTGNSNASTPQSIEGIFGPSVRGKMLISYKSFTNSGAWTNGAKITADLAAETASTLGQGKSVPVTAVTTTTPVTAEQLCSGAIDLSTVIAGASNLALPTAALIIAALPPGIPLQGQYTQIVKIRNNGTTQTLTVTDADGNVTLTGTMTIANNTVREFELTVTSATTVTLTNAGTKAL